MQIAGASVGVARTKTTEQHPFFVGFVIAVVVFQKQHIGGLAHNQTTVGKHHARWNGKPFGKARKFIGLAVAVAVFANQNIVAAARVFAFVGIVFGNQHKKSPALVPSHGDGVHYVGFVGKSFEPKIGGNLNVFPRFFGRQRGLAQLRARAFFVVGQFGFGINQRQRIEALQVFEGFFAHRPTDSLFEQRHKFGLAPRVFVVSVGRIKHAAFAVRSHPSVGFGFSIGFVFVLVGLNFAACQHQVVGLQFGVQIGFVQGFQRHCSRNSRVFHVHGHGANGVPSMPPKLPAHHLNHLFGIAETIGSAMHRHQAFAFGHKLQQGLLLWLGNAVVIGIEQHGIKLSQVTGVEVVYVVAVRKINAFCAQRRHYKRHALNGAVVAIVAQKQHFEAARIGFVKLV